MVRSFPYDRMNIDQRNKHHCFVERFVKSNINIEIVIFLCHCGKMKYTLKASITFFFRVMRKQKPFIVGTSCSNCPAKFQRCSKDTGNLCRKYLHVQ